MNTTIHIDGFEEFAGEQNPASAMQRADYATVGQWALVQGRQGGAALSGNACVVSRGLPWNGQKFAVGFAHMFTARGSACWLNIGDKQIVLWTSPDSGVPYLNDVPGGALPTINRWYYYELEVDRTAGTVSLFINNRPDAVLQIGQVVDQAITVNLGYMNPASYRPGVVPVPSDSASKSFDDFYMRDGARLEPIAVTTRFPTADKHVEFFAADPTKNHNASLSLHPPKPLDNYVASDEIGAEDRFTSGMPLTNGNDVIATGIVVLARKSPQMAAKLGVFIGGQDGAPLREDSRVVGSEWHTQFIFFNQNNDDTAAGIAAADFGITVQPN
jgi:hypothetical protein